MLVLLCEARRGAIGMIERPPSQCLVHGLARSYGELWGIVTHPAYRLGFLDGQENRPFDHDRIIARIEAETLPSALRTCGWPPLRAPDMLIEESQVRYEEGRLLAARGIRCRSWRWPSYPPKAVRAEIEKLVRERAA